MFCERKPAPCAGFRSQNVKRGREMGSGLVMGSLTG
jgi:hypothetical protein